MPSSLPEPQFLYLCRKAWAIHFSLSGTDIIVNCVLAALGSDSNLITESRLLPVSSIREHAKIRL